MTSARTRLQVGHVPLDLVSFEQALALVEALVAAKKGGYVAGRLPVVVMQNSGLGVSLNALGSLHLLYEMPCLILVTWRGMDGQDAPEHLVIGNVMLRLFDLFDLPSRAPRVEDAARDIEWAATTIRARRKPACLVVRPDLFA
jgi:sulfopyruvate decarboxylase TPP-binding subunit